MHEHNGQGGSSGAGDAAYLSAALQRVEEALAFQDRRLDQLHEEVLALSARVVTLTRKVEALDRRTAGADAPGAGEGSRAGGETGDGGHGARLDAGEDLGTPPIG